MSSNRQFPASTPISHVFKPSVPDLYVDIPGLHSVIPRPATHVHNFSATTLKFISKHEMQKSWRAIIKANHETIKSNHEILPKAIITAFFRMAEWRSWVVGMMCIDDGLSKESCGVTELVIPLLVNHNSCFICCT